jgi:NTE family protein
MSKDRALVLGGGGPVGIAWEAGLAAGLKEGGVDVARANFILGTSAGSFVGALLAGGREPASLAQAQIEAGRAQAATPRDPNRPRPPAPDLAPLLRFMMEAPADREPPPEFLAKIGAFALSAQTMGEAEFMQTFGSLATGERAWPENFACTAVDAESGAFRTWAHADAIPLARGVASSCSVPGIYPPIAIAGRQWIDGGMRSSTSADLAAGYMRVLIVAVIAGADDDPRLALLAKRMERERAAIADAGGVSELIAPDEASRAVFGVNLMTASRRAEIAEAGIAQGRREAERLYNFWN